MRTAEILEQMRLECGGTLTPEYVVDRASEPDHPLHGSFTWDDTEAARKWRVHQARNLIRVHVNVIWPDTKPTRVFVSLMDDRRSGVGYRSAVDVLADDDLRDQLIAQAKKDADLWRKKYGILRDVAAKILHDVADEIEHEALAEAA
jgi:hypothetical protein